VVTSTPPADFIRGQPFEYRLEGKAKGGKIAFQLESGPPGMTVTANGLLTWQPPVDLAPSMAVVTVRVEGGKGKLIRHQFALSAVR
jgi:hypothetical protein